MASAKYEFALSELRFSNGRTAMLFSDTGEFGKAVEGTRAVCRLKKNEPTAARVNSDSAASSNGLGQREERTGRTVSRVVSFHLLPCLSFSGRTRLPTPSLQRLK